MANSDAKTKTTQLLQKLNNALVHADMWSSVAPSTDALASTAPFACDSMSFENWLQFIFVPKMQSIIDSNHGLPNNIAILPMAEQSWMENSSTRQLFSVLAELDNFLSSLGKDFGE